MSVKRGKHSHTSQSKRKAARKRVISKAKAYKREREDEERTAKKGYLIGLEGES